MLVGNLIRAFDPVAFARDMDFHPYDWQTEFLRSSDLKVIFNCCRQSGKSTITSIKTLHTSLFNEESLILLLSPSQRQSGELFKKIITFYHKLKNVPRLIEDSATKCTFENGSRIISLPGKEGTIRGYSSADLVVVDEASRVDDDLIGSVTPMLGPKQGKLILLSTPWGKRGYFYKVWEHRYNWKKYKLTADKCSHLTKEFLDDEREEHGDFMFKQEYLCEFVDTEDQFFNSELIEKALSNEVQPIYI